jgi:thymidylate kinase
VDAVLARVRRASGAEVRDVLELRALTRQGRTLPDDDPAVLAAVRLEARLGGGLLRTAPGAYTPQSATAAGTVVRRVRADAGRLRYRLKPRVVVALTGVDGAGKSTVAGELARTLDAAGVVSGRVWARPGLGLRGLSAVAQLGKRLLREDPTPGVRRMAADTPQAVRSRRGLLGWAWSMAITGAFLANVWRQHLAAQGVVVYDRHLPDAMATMDVLYRGSDLRVQRALIRLLLPRADLTVYLDIPADVAVQRKPGDTIGAGAVAAQLASYQSLLQSAPNTVVIDATQPPADTALQILARLSDQAQASDSA